MLLGRPWQFDSHAVHDGGANTYTLTKDGVKHKPKPMMETTKKVCSVAKICVVDGKKFLEDMRHEPMCFAIIPKDGKEEVEEVPAEVADLLEEFPDIISDNVPDGLPPVWKISHQMDLVPRTSLPNKAAHRMTPAKSEELNRQVHELL